MWNYNRRKREISPSSGTSAWGRIRQIKQLGKGTYGTVWLARSSSRGLVAVKELILRRPADVDAIENEIEIMQRIKAHGNILSLYEYYRSNTTVQLVLQYCEGGEVLDAIAQRRGLSENEAKVIMKQTFDALRHCHMMNICHRDLKPQNLLLRTSIESGQQINERTAHVVICDFGVSTIVSNQRLRKLIGTVSYMAPEVFHRNYDISCDVWSAGVILFQLLSGFKPFENRRDIEMDSTASLERAFRKHPELWHSRVSASCKSLIKRLLQLDATRRPSCDDILRLDPWFQAQDRRTRRTYSMNRIS